MARLLVPVLAAGGVLLEPALARAAAAPPEHQEAVAPVVLALAIMLIVAKLGAELATRVGQPAVLGELLMGVVLGNLSLVGINALDELKTDSAIDLLAQLGVILLLFEVGLESTVREMLSVGFSSLLVAMLGVLTPFALGWALGAWLLPDASRYVHAFLGATLTATSVSITTRVLQDLGRSQSKETRIILGASVIDDVLGLVILAVVTGAIAAADVGSSLSALQVGLILGKTTIFLAAAITIGVLAAPRLFALASHLQARGVLLATGLTLCFVLAYLADFIGLAPIVGAFAAGLVLENVHYTDFVNRGERGLEDLVRPLSSFLVPVFFVLMGLRTDLRALGQPGVLGLAAALTFAAVVGKQACGLGALGRGVDRVTIGIGMVPRGEVGLIFASVGLGLSVKGERIVDQATFSAVVIMVMITTFITPPALKWSLGRPRHRPPEPALHGATPAESAS